MESRLLDLKDCKSETFHSIYQEMLHLSLLQQPAWFRPLLRNSRLLQRWLQYTNPTRPWEYPWAVLAADLGSGHSRSLDVGGGGSPFALYLAKLGLESFVTDPSLDLGRGLGLDRNKGLYRNVRALAFRTLIRMAGINALWGVPNRKTTMGVHYYPYSAVAMNFPDQYFDRVFCLSVMEHIPVELWPKCMSEFERVLKPGGRLGITLDMGSVEADARQYLKLVGACSLKLLGNPYYEVPISREDKQLRHPGHTYETVGLVWQG